MSESSQEPKLIPTKCEIDLVYDHIQLLDNFKPTKRLLLAKRFFWEYKRDGENIHARMTKNPYEPNGAPFIQISSRHQDIASQEIVTKVTRSPDWEKYVKLITDNPNYVPYFEECVKGRSVTGIEEYDRDYLFLFDILDLKTGRFLNYTQVHQIGFHYDIPVVELFQETKHRTIKDLLKSANHALTFCNEMKPFRLEGMVVKAYGDEPEYGQKGLLMFKVKLDIPKAKKEKHMQEGKPEFPPLPLCEVMGDINKAHQQLGEDIKVVGKAMPLIAKLVGESCTQEKFDRPVKQLFACYQDYLTNYVNQGKPYDPADYPAPTPEELGEDDGIWA